MSRVTVALVMPVRNEEASVQSTLDAVFASTRLPDEIVIADGMSTDNTVANIKAYEAKGVDLRVVQNPSLYSGGGRNIGIRNSSGEVIVLADFGNLVDPQWIEELVRPFEEGENVDMVAGLHCPLITSDFEHCMAAIHYFHESMLHRYTPEQKRALIPKAIIPGGASLGLTRDIWRTVGGYPEWLPKSQDRLFSRKAHCLGARVTVSWGAVVLHHIRRSPKDVFMQLFAYGRGCGRSCCRDRHVIKTAGIYALLIVGLGFGAVVDWVWPVVMLSATAYVYKAAIRKVLMLDGCLRRIRYLWIAPMALVSRDLGLLFGTLVGWLEWFFVPKYRRLFEAYTKECDRKLLASVSRS